MSRDEVLIQRTVVSTLQMLGVASGFVSYNRASKLWGKRFREMARRGDVKPVSKGEGVNGTLSYSVTQILEKMA